MSGRLPDQVTAGEAGSGCCFRYAENLLGFELLTAAEQRQERAFASAGISLLWKGYLFWPYTILRSGTELLLATAVIWLFLSLPFGFLLAPFLGYEGIVGRYLQRYVALAKVSFVTAVLFGLIDGSLVNRTGEADGVEKSILICFYGGVAFWRFVVTTRLLREEWSGSGYRRGAAVNLGERRWGRNQAWSQPIGETAVVENRYIVYTNASRHRDLDCEVTGEYKPFAVSAGEDEIDYIGEPV